jgi:hypothetical protein
MAEITNVCPRCNLTLSQRIYRIGIFEMYCEKDHLLFYHELATDLILEYNLVFECKILNKDVGIFSSKLFDLYQTKIYVPNACYSRCQGCLDCEYLYSLRNYTEVDNLNLIESIKNNYYRISNLKQFI